MRVIYVAGAYRGETNADVAKNIKKARDAAKRLWNKDTAVFCPHMNTAFFDGIQPDNVWLEGGLEILSRCDIIFMLKDWEKSYGASIEHSLAKDMGMEIIYESEDI